MTELVLLSASGVSHSDLAERFKISKQHVSNICCTDEAEELRTKVRQGIEKKATESLPERLTRLQEKALKRVEDVLDNDDLHKRAPLMAVQAAFKVLGSQKGLLPEKAEAPSNNTTNNFLIANNEVAQRLLDGLNKSQTTKLLGEVMPHNVDTTFVENERTLTK